MQRDEGEKRKRKVKIFSLRVGPSWFWFEDDVSNDEENRYLC